MDAAPLPAPAPLASRWAARPALLATALYAAATAVAFWPVLVRLSQALLGPPEDNMQDLWNTWYGQLALDGGSVELLETKLVRFPEGASLLHHSISYSNVFAIWVVRKVLGIGLGIPSLVALHNAALLASVPLSGLGAFLLARRFGAGAAAAIVAGYVFAFSPWHVGQLQHHLHVATTQYVPFFVLFHLRAEERRRWADVALAAAFLALSALSSWYYLVYGALYLAFRCGFEAVRARRVPWGAAGLASATLAGALVLASPLLVPMIREALGSATAFDGGHETFVADAVAWFTFPPHHLLAAVTEVVRDRFTGNPWEAPVYLGLANLALFSWGLARPRDRRPAGMGFLAAGALFFAVIAAGSSFHVLGEALFPAPGRLLELLPLVRNARTPARAAVYVLLFVSVGVALALSAASAHLAARPRLRAAVLAAAAVAIAVDFFPRGLETTPVQASPGYAVVARDPEGGFGILDLPAGYDPGNRYMMEQLFHRRPIVVATVSRAVRPALADRLEFADLEAQKRQLRAAHVKYVVLHKDILRELYLGPEASHAFDERYAHYRSTYEEVYSDDDTSVLVVR